MNILSERKIFSIVLSLLISFCIESYIVLIENDYLLLNFSNHDFIALFSFKEYFLILIVFLIFFYIFSNENKKISFLNFLYDYRLPLCFVILIFSVIFQIHGSSINELNLFHVNHNTLIGVSRPIRSDEYMVNTLFAFSQYMTDFSYFSDIVRGTATDMFIVYGQPVLDIGTIFRPFLIGYLFLNPARGLSFFWIGRLVFLFLISFEFGMILTNKNKVLSLAYSFLITLSPLVQWWFAINGLVEQLIFGQLGVLLIHWYMTNEDYKKRLLMALGFMICVGGYLLVFYPSWQIPFAYVFVLLSFWIFLKNKSKFSYSKKDLLILIVVISIFSIIMVHILSNSLETIKIVLNTSYPGSETFNGGGILNTFSYYVSTIFFPLNQENFLLNACEYSSFVDLFPIPLILAGIILFYQKTKDKLLVGLLILFFILTIFYLIQLPDFVINFTLRSHIKTDRLFSAISFLGVLILIRSISNLKEFKYKKLITIISLILSILMVYYSTFEFNNYYLNWMPFIAVIFYFILYLTSFLASSKRNQKIFFVCILVLSCLTGALVNPIDYGDDVIYESDYLNQVSIIVENNPDAIWITQGMFINNIIPVGAKTINSVNVYPDLTKWEKLDVNNKYGDIYNRYAHIDVDLIKDNNTYFKLLQPDMFKVYLNVNDLEKINVSYIATNSNLEEFSNDDVKFEKIYQDYEYKIYKIIY